MQTEPVEIPLAQGLDQKTARLFRSPGALRSAENVDFRHAGMLSKRRGYTRVNLDNEVGGHPTEQVFLNVTTLRNRLVLFGSEYLYDLASLTSAINGTDALVRRGPVLRGMVTIQHVVSSAHGSEV